MELKEVKLREGYYVMDPTKAVELVDENTCPPRTDNKMATSRRIAARYEKFIIANLG